MSLAAKLLALFGRRAFNISPSVSGKSVWDLDNDGPLNLGAGGTWTITPLSSFMTVAKAWGAGARSAFGAGGAGGYATGRVLLVSGLSYTLYVGATGAASAVGGSIAGGAPGGGNTNVGAFPNGQGGAGYSGLHLTVAGTAVLIAGGGGGGGHGGAGGAGGGTNGEAGATFSGTVGGGGGTQSAGGAGGGHGDAGSSLQGGSCSSPAVMGGGGGGGYFGGGASGEVAGGSAGGGGGGSGYFNPGYVVSGTLTAGSGTTPGNSGDSDRGGSGDVATAGRVRLA